MVQSPSWEANWFAASQDIPRISRNQKVHYRTHKRPPPVPVLTWTHEDRTDGEIEELGTYIHDPESKMTKLGRRQSTDNNSDGDAQKDEASMTAPPTNAIRSNN